MLDLKHQYKPIITRARNQGICCETGKKISAGEECIFDPLDRKTYSFESPTAQEYLETRD